MIDPLRITGRVDFSMVLYDFEDLSETLMKSLLKVKLQWNPVNTTTFGPWKTGCIDGVVLLKGFFK